MTTAEKGIRHRQMIRNTFFGGGNIFKDIFAMLFSGFLVLVAPTGLLFVVMPISFVLAMRVMITAEKLFP